jgi:hypothetical protein
VYEKADTLSSMPATPKQMAHRALVSARLVTSCWSLRTCAKVSKAWMRRAWAVPLQLRDDGSPLRHKTDKSISSTAL